MTNIKRATTRMMEYTPFVGIIPGSIRLHNLRKSEKDHKIHQVSINWLNTDTQSDVYSPKKELGRGIVSCIPIANVFLIPIDVGCWAVKKIWPSKDKAKTLDNLKKSLQTLDKWYEKSDELRAQKASNCKDLCDYCDRHPNEGIGIYEEIFNAFKTACSLLKKQYNFEWEFGHIGNFDCGNIEIPLI